MDYHKLLNRPEVHFDMHGVAAFLRGKTVLVTGASGSIGSEICRMLLGYPIAKLVQIFRSERGMIASESVREGSHNGTKSEHYLGDITDSERMDFICRETHPQIIFHAAAHKHVPLMERCPGEAVKNNVFGTQVVANCCVRYGAQLILVSTDKASNPTSVMGATKRAAEICVQKASNGNDGFCMARLINVIGSSGSVLEIWKRQIDSVQQLTITHPEMTRYFMTMRESALLLLKAASIAKGNERFVFDMNTPTRIIDLAQRFQSENGIERDLLMTSIRPGEKIHEDSPCEETENIISPGIRVIYLIEQEDFLSRLNRAVNASADEAIDALQFCLPEYRPKAVASK